MDEKKRSRFAGAVAISLICGIAANYAYGHFIDPATVTVPDVVNGTLHEAQTKLHDAELDDSIAWVDGGVKDLVVEQAPRGGERKQRGAPIKLWVQIGTSNELTPLSTPRGSSLAVRSVTIPSEYTIAVKLAQSLHVDGRSAIGTAEGELAEPIAIAGDVLAARGSAVLLDVFPSREGPFSIVRLALRECHQVDGRTLYVRAKKLERGTDVGFGSLAFLVFAVTIFGAFAGLFLWVCGLFVGVWVTPDIICIPVAGLSFFVGLLIAAAVMAGNAVDVPAGAALHFQTTDSTIVTLVTGV